ncbi:SDR family NAD(P)-dependent oxidoreductase [Tellurirhabdus rosea]|uniref:SDR family NAD(P)-dependent oxidoreductase n=1 Tax=Tellurirhabdus rosea TaxID=2674997 RepID=UPI00225861F6|nr:SDR family NAD(P)-dependent oxidoreductase [Tellurirhabdus rosea]
MKNLSWNASLLLTGLCLFLSSCSTSRLSRSDQRKTAGKTFVIVGASSGFGRGVAEQLGGYKANVVLAARRTDLLEEIARNIRAAGGNALVVPLDISKPEDVQRLATETLRQFGDIDVWVNMAGVGAIGRFWEIPVEDQARIVDVNLKGVIYGSHAAIRQFRTQGYGTLINMGSVESFSPLAYHASYAATKAGLLNLTQALNHELRLDGKGNIRVINVEPWAVDTPFWRHAANYSGREGRMAAMDPPQKVVNAVIRASLHGRHEMPVGWKATGAWFSHRIFPRLTERISANLVHRYQMRNAPPLSPTSGSAFQPMPEGRGVDDGVKKKMKEERRARKQENKTP